MKIPVFVSDLSAFARRASRATASNVLRGVLAGVLLVQAHSASAALSFGRGTPTTVGSVRFSSSPDSVLITGALTAPGTITTGLAIPANRIQYDVISSDQGPMYSWTLYYSPLVGPLIIGAATPVGYIDFFGTLFPEGGNAYDTLFNAGFGIYNYNLGAPWIIDYEPDHITFTASALPLPANAGVGFLNPTPYLPSFGIEFSPSLANGLVPATALVGPVTLSGQVYGPLPGNQCLSILCTNITVETCLPCVPVPFSATAIDTCCPTPPVLQYFPPPGTCFPTNTTTPVMVVASDTCGNSATNFFTVTVVPDPACLPTNCISIFATNVVAYTCSNCTVVPFSVFATDACCPIAPPTVIINPPPTTCFPVNSTTPVHVLAYDVCGHTNTATFTVTVLPGPNCGNTNCIQISSSNLTTYTCSNCTTVSYNVTATDTCCPGQPSPTLTFNPPETTCFPVNSATLVTATAVDQCGNSATSFFTVTVLPGAGCNPTNCISIYTTNITAFTCSNCTTVSYNAFAVDTCCPGTGATLIFNPPDTTCFPVNTTTPVLVTAIDQCGHTNSTTFTVTVLPGVGCPTNCISIYATNITAFTCSNCTTVTYNAFAVDPCCAVGATLTFNPPETTCFPVNVTTPVQVTATDPCGNTNTTTFTVTVLRDPGCPTNCIALYATNITAFTCSNCTFVPFNVSVFDPCCAVPPTLTFNPPETTCFAVNTTTPIVVTATDQCGNTTTSSFTVTVLPGLNCPPTNCISLYASNVVVYTCSNCVPVPYNVTAFDTCCTNIVSLVYNPPVGFCFPLNSVTPVQVMASDLCGNTAVGFFTVTVLPAAGCGGGAPGISITGPGGPGGSGTNYFAVWWNGTNAQVEATADLLHWQPVPGGTNSPVVVPSTSPMNFYRLHYH